MKKLLLLSMMCFAALTMQAQRCAVLEFNAKSGVNQSDVNGIADIFNTHFSPTGYEKIERTRIDRLLSEQGLQQSNITSSAEAVRIGRILNVSRVVIGTVTKIMGEYNVDVSVVVVETGEILTGDGQTFSGSSYRANVKALAERVANKVNQKEQTRAVTTQSTRGFVDLGLPSGTLWKASNESGCYKYDDALSKFGEKMPSQGQWEELINYCKWEETSSGYKVTGSNGNYIILPDVDGYNCDGHRDRIDNSDVLITTVGGYWSSSDSESAYGIKIYLYYRKLFNNYFHIYMGEWIEKCYILCVRLVYNP